MVEWLEDIQQKVQPEMNLLNELSEKKAKLEKYKTIQRDVISHSDTVIKIEEKLKEDDTMKCKEIEDSIKKYEEVKQSINKIVSVSISI